MRQLAVIIGLLLLLGCRKEDPQYPFEQENIVREGLTLDEDSAIGSLEAIIPRASEIYLGNGETVESFLNRTNPNSLPGWGNRPMSPNSPLADERLYRFITDLTWEGNLMVDNDSIFAEEPASNEVDPYTKQMREYKKPKQVGYGYVYNGDIDLGERKIAGKCGLKLFGIDCSGMVTRMLIRAGVNTGTKKYAAILASEEVLNGLLINSAGFENFNYEYEYRPESFLNEVSSGDIVYFMEGPNRPAFHIGVVINRLEGPLNPPVFKNYIYQSNGAEDEPDCEKFSLDKNGRKTRGPRCVPLNQLVYSKYGPSHRRVGQRVYPYFGILHLVPKKPVDFLLLGSWRFTGESTTVAAGGREVSIGWNKSVNVDNLTVAFDANNNFSFASNDPLDACSGRFIVFNNGNSIKLFGCSLYDRDPIAASITKLTDTHLTLSFRFNNGGYTQNSILYFER